MDIMAENRVYSSLFIHDTVKMFNQSLSSYVICSIWVLLTKISRDKLNITKCWVKNLVSNSNCFTLLSLGNQSEHFDMGS
jgi:hypothetical protein